MQNLANENNYLRQKLAARTDTKFVKGILEHSVKNIHLVQVDSKTNLTQHCAELEKEKIGLKYEIYQLQNVLNSHYPGATTVMLYQNQLAAEVRLREYQAIQHDSMHEKMEQQSEALRKLTDVCEEFAKQNISLHTAANEKPPAPKQVSRHQPSTICMLHLHTQLLNLVWSHPAAPEHMLLSTLTLFSTLFHILQCIAVHTTMSCCMLVLDTPCPHVKT